MEIKEKKLFNTAHIILVTGESNLPNFPIMKSRGMNWAAVIAGLAAVGIGGYTVYWLWKNGYLGGGGGGCKTNGDCPTGFICSNGKCVSQQGCTSNTDCPAGYSCVSGKCTPNEFIPCSNLNFECLPGWSGLQRCDMKHNLCRCNGSQWDLIEQNSQICLNDTKHLACFTNPDGIAVCYWTRASGQDTCPIEGKSQGCPCSIGVDCSPETYCCGDNCRDKPTGYFYATVGNGLNCWSDGTTRYAQYNFNDTGITSFRRPVAYHTLADIKIYLAGSQFGAWGGYFYDGYNSGWREVHHPLANDPCVFGCNPLSLGTWAGTMRCMDSFLVSIGSITGPPNITGISFTFI